MLGAAENGRSWSGLDECPFLTMLGTHTVHVGHKTQKKTRSGGNRALFLSACITKTSGGRYKDRTCDTCRVKVRRLPFRHAPKQVFPAANWRQTGV